MKKAILLSNVSKKFELVHEGNFSFIKKKENFFSLKNINLKIKKGECLGIIGLNGSGKTTLLRIMAGILQPSTGNIKVEGKSLSLLDLGFGFREDLTGRDNIFLYGSLLGIDNRTLRENLETIIDFSGLSNFLDVNVKDYSNGMRLRLAFSIAMIDLPDIVLIDEIISVGDSEFQIKCNNSIKEMIAVGKTLVLVSHDLETVKRLCSRVILLNQGKIVEEGNPNKVINSYLYSSNIYNYDKKFKELLNRFNRYKQIEKEISSLKKKQKEEGVFGKIFTLPLELSLAKQNKSINNIKLSILSLSDFLLDTYSHYLSYLWGSYQKESGAKVKRECLALIDKIKIIYNIKEKLEDKKDTKYLFLLKQIDGISLSFEKKNKKISSIKKLVQDYESLIISNLSKIKVEELFYELKNIIFNPAANNPNLDIEILKYCIKKYEELGIKKKIRSIEEINDDINFFLKDYYTNLENTVHLLKEKIDIAEQNNQIKKKKLLEKKKEHFSNLKMKTVGEFRKNIGKLSHINQVSIINVSFQEDNNLMDIYTGNTLKIKITYKAEKKISNPVFGIAFFKEDGTLLAGPNTKFSNMRINKIEGSGEIYFVIEDLPLLEGIYLVSCTIHPYNSYKPYDHHDKRYSFHVKSKDIKDFGLIHLKGKWELKAEKKVIVTGGAGFIGSYVIEELLKKGYSITVVDNLSKKESKLPKLVNFINLDLTDSKRTSDAFKDQDFCINMASKIGGIGYFHKFPATILSENNKIYSSTFEAAVENRIKKMIFISSSMVFESTNIFPSKEKDLDKIPPPLTGYGFSKLVGEYYCKTFNEQFGLNYTIIRPFNAYGINEYPGDFIGYAHVIPDLIKKILSGEYPLEMLGDGQQTRCFTHVKDIARGIVMAMESENALNEDFNLGSEDETKMIYLAELLWELCDRKENFKVKYLPSFKYDIKKRVPYTGKASHFFGWKPLIKFEDGLKETVEWLKGEIAEKDI